MKSLTAVLSLLSLAARRLWHQRLLMACLLAGLVAAVGLLSGIPLYADAVQNRLLQGELTEAGTYRPPFTFLWRYVGAWNGDITWETYQPINSYLTEQATGIIDLPVDAQIRHVATAKLRLFPGADVSFNQNEPLLWANLGFITNLDEQIELVEGTYPAEAASTAAIEVIVSRDTADQLGLQVGEAYTLFGAGDNTRLPLQIVGVWQPRDRTDPFWFYQPDAFAEMLFTSEGQFAQQVAPVLADAVSTAVWYQLYDGGRIRPASVNDFLQNVTIVEARATALLNGTTLDASPVSALQNYGRSNNLLTLTLTIFSIPLIGIILYFISLIANMVVARGASEIAVWRSRGTTRGQVVGVYLLEGLLVGSLGLAGGLWLALQIARLMGRTRTFLDPAILTPSASSGVGSGVGAGELTPVLSGTAVSYALIGVGLALLALLIPALLAAAHTIVTMRWQQARSLLAPAWQRYFLDVLLLVPPFYGWYQLDRQGTISLLGGGRDPFANPLLFLVPILFCFSLALVALRLFPLLIGGLAWLAEKLPGTTLLLTLRQLARATAQYTGPLLLLTLTLSLASFTASMAVTFDDHLTDQIYYQTGADLNLAELGEDTEQDSQQQQGALGELTQPTTPPPGDEDEPRWLFLPVTDHLLVAGVQAAARVGEYTAVSSIGGRQQSGRILGVDRVDFAQVAFYRADFAGNEALGGLMNRLAVRRDHILVSRDFLARNSLQVGDPLRLTIGAAGEFAEAEFTIAGPLDLFPTQYPQDGPFLVANLDHLHEALGGTYPYNVWLQTDPAVPSSEIVDGVRQLGFAVITAQDARDRILQEQTRPERQGLFGLLSVGFLAAAVLTVLGFLVYAVVSFRQRTIQLGMLRAIGLSVGQMAAYLVGEQAVLIAAGVGLGTGLGVWASRLFIPFLQVGEGKTAVTPPFIVQIAWEQLGTIYALFAAMFIIAVLVLIALVARMRIFEAVKLGEAV
ncbi:MAG: ABC transporter permease [Anaerolineaceae bacterium]|nr:ABC transporter permease [Anaerolineaceae bacterium]